MNNLTTDYLQDESADEPPPLSQRLGASLSYFILAAIGTSIYLIFLASLYKGRQKLSDHTFYLFVYHFAIADLGEVAFVNFVISVPLSFTGRPLYGDGAFVRILCFADSICYYAILSLVSLMALNRFLVFYNPSLCKKIFERPNIYFTLIIPWIAGFTLDGIQYLMSGCYKTYDNVGFNIYYNCPENPTALSNIYSYIDKLVNIGLPFLSLFLYLLTFVKMRYMMSGVGPSHEQRSTSERRNKRERSFLIQAFIICLTLGIESVLFYLVPALAENNVMDWYWVSLLLGWAIIINSSLNPVVYFFFNYSLRQLVVEFFRKGDKNGSALSGLNQSHSHANSQTGSTQTAGSNTIGGNLIGRRLKFDVHH